MATMSHAKASIATTNISARDSRENTAIFGGVTYQQPCEASCSCRLQSFAERDSETVQHSNGCASREQGEAQSLQRALLTDAMQSERWDIEFDLEYQLNSRNRDQVVTCAPNQQVEFMSEAGVVSRAAFEAPGNRTVVEKRRKDQFSARLGGTYNMLPGLFSISAGMHYENRGVDPD
ncbi:MAG: hypothetical protein RL701_6514 [Pseudomonadota bacterium]